MTGSQIAHYLIKEKLGEGGMGIVYKAEDTILKRTVALKFLKPQAIGSEEEKARFFREAQAAAALDHPNICTVYEIKEVEGPATADRHTFIAMAYIDGQSLDEIIESGPLEFEQALDIATQIADGLQEAHDKGITHRDIKSANIMMTQKGQVKILDFGIAHLEGGKTLTKTGTPLGTPSYMSPEQIKGEEVDHRSDIFSLGILLYEMITGKLPFKGDYKLAVMHSILYEDPTLPESYDVKIPKNVQGVILKSIEKEPANRYQSMTEFTTDLQALKKGSKPKIRTKTSKILKGQVSTRFIFSTLLVIVLIGLIGWSFNRWLIKGNLKFDRNSIAVMYFDNLTNESELDWYRRGFAELLTTYLRQEPTLRVTDSDNLFYFLQDAGLAEDRQIPLKSALNIARKLEVGTLIMGNFFQNEGRTTVNIKLYDVNKREFFAGEQSDILQYDEIFNCMNKLSHKVKTQLEVVGMEYDETMANEINYTNSVEAFKNFVLGEMAFLMMDFNHAIKLCQKAIEIDSTFIQAYFVACIGALNLNQYSRAKETLSKGTPFMLKGTLKDKLVFEFLNAEISGELNKVIKAILQLLSLDPNNQGNLLHLGYTYNRLNQPEKAIEHLEKSYRMRPKFRPLYYQLGLAYHRTKQFDKELTLYKNGLKIFPDYFYIFAPMAREYYRQGDYQEERKTIDQMFALARQDTFKLSYYHAVLGDEYLDDGYLDRAIAFFQQSIKLDSTNAKTRFYLARAFYANKEWSKALQAYQTSLSLDDSYIVALYWIAQSYEKLNKFGEAIEAYQNYLTQHSNSSFVASAKERLTFLRNQK
jgi:serine/threonine protein kinase/cytochrome c-type biogenesis protein CcmH/NrfG